MLPPPDSPKVISIKGRVPAPLFRIGCAAVCNRKSAVYYMEKGIVVNSDRISITANQFLKLDIFFTI